MALFCSAREFDSLCRELGGRADTIRLQAKGGSMFPFIRSGDWVTVSLKGDSALFHIRKGDVILFKKEDSKKEDSALFLHRVIRQGKDGFTVKGDLSFGSDGAISADDVLGRVVSVERKGRRVDLYSRANRFIAASIANVSLLLQYPALFAKKFCALCGKAVFRIQGLRPYRCIAKKLMKADLIIREARPEDAEGIRDLFIMAGHDVKKDIIEIKKDGFWLVAERNGRIAGAITVTRYEKDPAFWTIFGLEVKPLFRGLGIDERLVNEALSRADACGAKEVGLFVNKERRPAISLYRKLGFEASDHFPAEFNRSPDELYMRMEKFRKTRLSHAAQGAIFFRQATDTLNRLDGLNIKMLLFKGPAVDSLIYGDLFRPRIDIDIAVRDAEMPAAEKALVEMGYTPPAEEKDSPLPEYLNSRFFTPPSEGLVAIHLHRHIVNNIFRSVDGALRMEMEKAWEETETFKGYRNIRVLKPEMNIVYMCDHALKHDYSQPAYLDEIKELITHYGKALDWGKLAELTRESCMERSVYYSLYFAKKLLSADVPGEVLTKLEPAKLTVWERRFVKDVLNNRQRPHSSFGVYLSDRKGFLKKAVFLSRAVFPPGFTLKGHLARIRRSVLA